MPKLGSTINAYCGNKPCERETTWIYIVRYIGVLFGANYYWQCMGCGKTRDAK